MILRLEQHRKLTNYGRPKSTLKASVSTVLLLILWFRLSFFPSDSQSSVRAIATTDTINSFNPRAGVLPRRKEYQDESCRHYTPECQSLETIQQKWGYGGKDYNQTECCISHRYIRDALMEVWDALDFFQIAAWMDGGSAIGIARHNGTQVPWEIDADLAFLVERKQGEMQLPPEYPAPVFLPGKREARSWLKRIVDYLNQQSTDGNTTLDYSGEELNPTEAPPLPWWYKMRLVNNTVHFQLFKRTTLTSGEEFNAHIDLFGVKRHLEPRVIDGVLRQSFNYYGCFQNPQTKDEHSYYVLPASPCQFYGKQVWCPRDIVSYLKYYYGDNVMQKGVSHDGFYGEDYMPGTGNGV